MSLLEKMDDFKKQLKEMSFYNAAEGDWSKEAGGRFACRKKLKEISASLMEHGITVDDLRAHVQSGSYLVSDGDWMVK